MMPLGAAAAVRSNQGLLQTRMRYMAAPSSIEQPQWYVLCRVLEGSQQCFAFSPKKYTAHPCLWQLLLLCLCLDLTVCTVPEAVQCSRTAAPSKHCSTLKQTSLSTIETSVRLQTSASSGLTWRQGGGAGHAVRNIIMTRQALPKSPDFDAAATPEAQPSMRTATQAHLQAAPHLPRGEARQELHAGARGVGAVQRIDDAVDVVQGQRVQDAVLWGPLPGTAQGCHLGTHTAMGVQSACTAESAMLGHEGHNMQRWTLHLGSGMPSREWVVLSQRKARVSSLRMACSVPAGQGSSLAHAAGTSPQRCACYTALEPAYRVCSGDGAASMTSRWTLHKCCSGCAKYLTPAKSRLAGNLHMHYSPCALAAVGAQSTRSLHARPSTLQLAALMCGHRGCLQARTGPRCRHVQARKLLRHT